MRAFVLKVCLFLVSRLANGQLPVEFQEALYKGEGLEFDDNVDDNDNYVSVIVGYRNQAAVAKFGDLRASGNVRQFKKMNAVTMHIPLSELASLQNDPDVAYVEEDTMVHLFAEEESWGIPVIQADTQSIPRPNSDSDCFKICIVDSGLLVRHPDIVSPFVRSFCLEILRFALTRTDHLLFMFSLFPAL
jgi:hypothetical protein